MALEREIFTYEDFLALSDEERVIIDQENDEMTAEELRELREIATRVVHEQYQIELLLGSLDLE
jgi:DNA transposition AAA+ family ATPase